MKTVLVWLRSGWSPCRRVAAVRERACPFPRTKRTRLSAGGAPGRWSSRARRGREAGTCASKASTPPPLYCTTTLTGAPPAQIELPSSRRQSVALSWVMQAPPAAQSGAVGARAEAGPLGGSVVEATRDADHASNGSKVTALLTPPHAACWRHACLMQVRWILTEGPVEGQAPRGVDRTADRLAEIKRRRRAKAVLRRKRRCRPPSLSSMISPPPPR